MSGGQAIFGVLVVVLKALTVLQELAESLARSNPKGIKLILFECQYLVTRQGRGIFRIMEKWRDFLGKKVDLE